jgi:phospholipase C
MARQVGRVVIMVQENHTTDNYFRGLAPFGAAVASDWPIAANPPASDQPHDRQAYFKWLTAGTATHNQSDTRAVLPYYMSLALTGAFLENHCGGFGTNSTPNHLLIVGGQPPTLKNPSSRGSSRSGTFPRSPAWLRRTASPGEPTRPRTITPWPSTPSSRAPRMWPDPISSSPTPWQASSRRSCSSGTTAHMTSTRRRMSPRAWTGSGSRSTRSSRAAAGTRPCSCSRGTTGAAYDDHVATPAREYTPDNVRLAYGPRLPLLTFGGPVKPGIDSRWCSHVSIPKTAIELLGLPALGVPRVDQDAGLGDLVDPAQAPNPAPPAYGSTLELPPDPRPPIAPQPAPPHPPGQPTPVGPVILRDGSTLPPPNDAPLPKQPNPPTA